MGIAMAPPMAGMAAAAPVEPVAMSEPCTMGQLAPCVCEATGTEGQKRCLYDAASPTMGTFGPCESCAAAPPAAEPGAQMPAAPTCVATNCPQPTIGEACCTLADRCGTSVAMGPCA
jgi:hypothetical protein